MKTKELCIHGLMIALVTVCTMVFQIPVSATQGYVHLGDSMILLVGVFFGARYGMVAGGIGSALADVLSGYSHWAPFTLIIKGLMGWLIGKIASGAGSRAKALQSGPVGGILQRGQFSDLCDGKNGTDPGFSVDRFQQAPSATGAGTLFRAFFGSDFRSGNRDV